MNIAVIIPFRLREGADMRRAANLEVVQAWWYAHGFDPKIVDDGLSGDAQFNRHRAYNRAVSGNPDADVFVFTEADMLIHPAQIQTAILLSVQPGLVVPFTQYRYLSDEKTATIRDVYHGDLEGYGEGMTPERYLAEFWARPVDSPYSIFGCPAESTMDNGRSIGAVNVVSAETLRVTGGFTESTSGNWYDDRIIEEGFAFLTGNTTQFVPGPAVHLYHLPGHKGDHLSHEDKVATANNREILKRMRGDIRHRRYDRVQSLMKIRKPS